METVAFYSYKGGVGRTLLVANTAQFLAMSGRRVVALDLDLEAPGLHQKLGTPEAIARAQTGELRGAVNELLEALTREHRPQARTLLETAVQIDLPIGTKGSLLLIPAGSAPSHAYWAALEKLNECLRNADARKGGLVEAIVDLQARIQREFSPDFLLIDSRTGITELGGLATSLLADRVVCLTTTAPESVDGTRVVADALRAAPRLASQDPLRLDFLITRVPADSVGSENVVRLKKEFGEHVAVLPHDSGIATKEQVLSGWRPVKSERYGTDDDTREAGTRLFSATLDWIAESFPGHKPDADSAKHRMQEVREAWYFLTRDWERYGGGVGSRSAWPVEQLRERVRFEKGKQSRQADIVAYDSPPQDKTADPLMIIEYVDKEDRDAVADWWLSNTKTKVVAILSSATPSSQRDHRLYSDKRRWDRRKSHSERWDLPLPHDFDALPDPTDVSVDALLDAVRRGHPEYVERLITEWVHSSASGLHGGAPWKPAIARKIIDGLARVEDKELAQRVLWAASLGHGRRRRGMWLGDGDEYLDEQVIAELFAPLMWRLPPEASIELMMNKGRPFGPPAGLIALGIMSRELLGLCYDPDSSFRREGQIILERSGARADADDDHGLYALAPAFRHTEITFKISSDRPPLALTKIEDDEDDERRHRPQVADVGKLVADRISTRSLVTTGLLGDYQAQLGKVILYSDAISECAEKLALKARHVASVTLIHETIHALMHVGRDLDRRMWQEFSLPRADNPLFEPSTFHEAVTQYFTYQHILRLGDPAMRQAFETMSDKQAPAYRAWRRLRNVPLEDVRTWFMSVRRGVGAPGSFSGVALRATSDEA